MQAQSDMSSPNVVDYANERENDYESAVVQKMIGHLSQVHKYLAASDLLVFGKPHRSPEEIQKCILDRLSFLKANGSEVVDPQVIDSLRRVAAMPMIKPFLQGIM